MTVPTSRVQTFDGARRSAFSIAELLVVLGILALLIGLLLPPLQMAHRQAKQTHCRAQLHQLGVALAAGKTEYGFYPLWDDGGQPTRFTWIDVLLQRGLLGTPAARVDQRPEQNRRALAVGYCPADLLPDFENAMRFPELVYPLDRSRGGVDYSYGIGVPLSTGGWAWRGDGAPGQRSRRLRDADRFTANRVLAGDAYAPGIFNLSGDGLTVGRWNWPTRYDNTVAWLRHGQSSARWLANLLFQDGHADAVSYAPTAAMPLNTMRAFVWQPGEQLGIMPDDALDGQYYPESAPPLASEPGGAGFPRELAPRWYTETGGWTHIYHK